jgi:hypothetical protein
MFTLTVEFPATLARQLDEQGISADQLKAPILEFVRLYVREHENNPPQSHTWTDGAEFAQRIITQNRQLFEELAQPIGD